MMSHLFAGLRNAETLHKTSAVWSEVRHYDVLCIRETTACPVGKITTGRCNPLKDVLKDIQ
jgi:hypothetical protein